MYDRSLLQEQNQNLAQLVENLEDEARIAGKNLKACKDKPPVIKTVEKVCEAVYVTDSWEPCHCSDGDD